MRKLFSAHGEQLQRTMNQEWDCRIVPSSVGGIKTAIRRWCLIKAWADAIISWIMMSVNVIILQVVGWKEVNNRSLSLNTNSVSRHMPLECCLHAETNQSLQHMALTIGRTWAWCLWILCGWNVYWNSFSTDTFSYYVKNVWTMWFK